MQKDHQNKHIPVLLEEVLQYLDPKKGETYLDLTAGYGGHSQVVLGRTLKYQGSTLVDRDKKAVSELQTTFASKAIDIIHSDFLSAAKQLKQQGRRYDMILMDQGVSSVHLDNASRGFSLSKEGPLDMRMDESSSLTAADIVNHYSERDLITVLSNYGQEPKSRTIAKLIIENRPLRNTTQLAQIVARAWPGHSKVHPATRTFQAIRIAVNDELNQLQKTLPILLNLLENNGRLVVISFHSLEDRLVKQFLQENAEGYEAQLKILTKRPIGASKIELVSNPRARSAKLRAAVKIKIKERELYANHG